MRALILVKQRTPLILADLELPALDVGQVLVKVVFSGICGKQIDEIDGRRGEDPYLPHLLGHEGAGIVVDVGAGVRKVQPGDHVVLHWMKGSGIDSAAPRFALNGTVVSAGLVTTFSDYSIVSENRMTRIPDDVPLDVASLLGCAVTTGLGVVFNNANLRPGESIVVFGVGGVGLNIVQAATLVSGYPIVAVDMHDAKLEQARRFGATHVVNARREDVGAILGPLSGGAGFDAAVDTTGLRDVRETAYRVTSNTGTTILVGVPDYRESINIDSFPLHFGRRILGSHGGETRPDRDIPRYIELYRRGKLKLEELITHRYKLAEINAAVTLVLRGEAGRCVISME